MIVYTPARRAKQLPVVDMLRPAAEAAAAIRGACRDTGFFYLVNHGIPERLVDGQLDWTRRFFALAEEAKTAVNWRRSPCRRGYEPLGGQVLDSGSPPDLKESFYVGRDLPADHPYVRRGLPNHGPNVWPAALPGFRAHTEGYFEAVHALAKRLMGLLALSLDLRADWFAPMLVESMPIMRLVHYPPRPHDTEFNQLGAGAHTDWGGITLLAQDDVGGLEVRTVAGEWVRATPFVGTFVVNLGDMIARWTNGLYRSTLHRVVSTPGRDRHSIAFFLNPDAEARIECLPTCHDAARPPRYAPCTVGEHIEEMYRLTFGEKRAA